MTLQGDDTGEASIIKFQGGPNKPDGPGEPKRWRRFKEFVFPWLKKGSDLGDAYATAKTAQEKNKADHIAQQAAETAAKSDVARQHAVKLFGENVDAIFQDDDLPDAAKNLKLMKLIESNPDLMKQWEKLQALLGHLHVNRGVSIEPLESEAIHATFPEEEVRVDAGVASASARGVDASATAGGDDVGVLPVAGTGRKIVDGGDTVVGPVGSTGTGTGSAGEVGKGKKKRRETKKGKKK